MRARNLLTLAISLAISIPCHAASDTRGATADFADAVYYLKGMQRSIENIRDVCSASFPERAGIYRKSYEDWTKREASMISDVKKAYEHVLDVKSAGDPGAREQVLAEDAALARQTDEQTQRTLGAVPRETLASKCAAYPDLLLTVTESSPKIATMLGHLRSRSPGP
jgi:hypothetical protein